MNLVCQFYKSTVGKKIIMALTGLVLLLFVIGHMLGNLKMFAGIDPMSGLYKIDVYAQMLRDIAAHFMGNFTFLWTVRIVLLICVVLHAVSAVQLTLINWRARPVDYATLKYRSANPASLTMFWGGLFLAAFIVFHILHFTTGTVHHQGFVEGHVYANVYSAFQLSPVLIFYILAMAALAAHLYHGAWSTFQTLGIDSPKLNSFIRSAAKVVAVLLFVGFCAVPVASHFHLVPPPVQTPAVPAGASVLD